MKNKQARFMFVFFIIVVTISCLAGAAFSVRSQNYPNEDTQMISNANYSGNYNLIYGDWEVTDYIADGKRSDKNLLESYIGTQISYRYNEMTIENINYLVEQYLPYAIAMEDRVPFIGSDYYPSDENTIFNTNSEYFAAFDPVVNSVSTSNLATSQIIIKDNNTLILKTCVGYCVLSRIAFLNDLDVQIPPV